MAGTRTVYIAYVPRGPLRFNRKRHTIGMEVSGMQVLTLNKKIMSTLDRMPGYMAYVYKEPNSKHAYRAILYDYVKGYVCIFDDEIFLAHKINENGTMKTVKMDRKWIKGNGE